MGLDFARQEGPFSSAKCEVACDSEGSPGRKVIFWVQK